MASGKCQPMWLVSLLCFFIVVLLIGICWHALQMRAREMAPKIEKMQNKMQGMQGMQGIHGWA